MTAGLPGNLQLSRGRWADVAYSTVGLYAASCKLKHISKHVFFSAHYSTSRWKENFFFNKELHYYNNTNIAFSSLHVQSSIWNGNASDGYIDAFVYCFDQWIRPVRDFTTLWSWERALMCCGVLEALEYVLLGDLGCIWLMSSEALS